MWPKANTPGADTCADTPKRFFSTRIHWSCTTLICRDVAAPRFNPQVLHNPLNTGVEGYAHTMHSLMNSGPFKCCPATLTVFPARGFARACLVGVSALADAVQRRLSNVCSYHGAEGGE